MLGATDRPCPRPGPRRDVSSSRSPSTAAAMHRGPIANPPRVRLDHQPREPRVQRQPQHATPRRCHRPVGRHRAELPQQPLGRVDARPPGRLEPREGAAGRAPPRRAARGPCLGEVQALHLGRVVLGPRVVVVLRVEPHAPPRAGASRAARALRRRGPRHLRPFAAWAARPRRVRGHPREARCRSPPPPRRWSRWSRPRSSTGSPCASPRAAPRGPARRGGRRAAGAPAGRPLRQDGARATSPAESPPPPGGTPARRRRGPRRTSAAPPPPPAAASGRSSARAGARWPPRSAAPRCVTRGAGLPLARESAPRARRRGWRSSPRRLRSGRGRALEPSQHRQREVALEVPLVKLVEQHRAHAGERRVGEQRRVSTPSVTKRIRVRALSTSSKRTW
jgi:hypothetical protein